MVTVGSALLIAINGISVGFTASLNKQFSNLASTILLVTSSQFSGGGGGGGGLGGAEGSPKSA